MGVRSDHSFVELVVGEGGGFSSPLYSFLRSSETRFLLTVLDGEMGDWSLVGGAGDKLDDGGDFFLSCGPLEVVTDI